MSRAAPDVTALILAAGRSTRMGNQNKLLLDMWGKPLVRWAVETALASRARRVLVVTGHQQAEVKAALADCDVQFIYNPNYADGLSTSVKAGLTAVPAESGAMLVCPGDMPLVTAEVFDALIEAHDPAAEWDICVPVYQGQRGNPVLLDRRFFPALSRITGDAGARTLIRRHPDAVRKVPVATNGIFMDVDTVGGGGRRLLNSE